MAIFNSYVSLPEGKPNDAKTHVIPTVPTYLRAPIFGSPRCVARRSAAVPVALVLVIDRHRNT